MAVALPCFIVLYVQPGAANTELSGFYGTMAKVRLRAQAIDNQANVALIAFLAEFLDIPKRDIEIVSGHHSRIKRVQLMKSSPKVHQLLLSKE
ncbi:MAG: hypothetical protein B7Z60_07270 [Ferrovum sp. 37-45-19]|jgi:hypothetical protein|uniref:DUF167 domain-containing protein n=1 Tax=Ferrovum sp. JA12 TaxID=1356299 RepID=UPI0007035C92|nr:DUF167 domain-containing protein [Ferrovum sp. JA12]OYV79044.1 MAG: hypothetical protein B7Z65_07945 [Ferrovum sp. 21-44-67]OYV93802.1 MAG: hypothetical protein B7Z60_07270 [Ferrovum sp. 37-45-19]OZB32082.1 MAG: hypothetical protein B7X47_07630 [Ferrovum sp. 34-44-207]HQT82118.1 DUF167 domain-containing protein [Ferrovaceae bacterium]KRH78608.1 hypothetical protein FERRO_16000 [Ferrovum sp. JA12]